ncbi:exodeoxyribonuclease V subunit gamma, partial [Klebsiella pneumoniae]|nr:exodeoxyribonuclease V subunit gamma [Klebsiella pneumoniae]
VQNLEHDWVKSQEESTLAGFVRQLPQQTVIRHIRHFLDSESEAGFLRGGITFCSMVPMRSLPFKVICLLGLNDGDFPRNTKAAVFDLIAKHPAKGDRARR